MNTASLDPGRSAGGRAHVLIWPLVSMTPSLSEPGALPQDTGPPERRPHRDKGSSVSSLLDSSVGLSGCCPISGTRTLVALMTLSCLFCYTALEAVPEKPSPAQERREPQASVRRLLGWRAAVGWLGPLGGCSDPPVPCLMPRASGARSAFEGLAPGARHTSRFCLQIAGEGNEPVCLVGDCPSSPCGDARAVRTVCPQNQGEQTQQRPLGLWLGLNPRARCQVEGGKPTAHVRLLGKLWRHSGTQCQHTTSGAGRGPAADLLPFLGLFGQFLVHSKIKRKAHPSSPTVSSPTRAVCLVQLEKPTRTCPSRQRPQVTRAFPRGGVHPVGLDKRAVTRVHCDTTTQRLSPALNTLCTPAAPRPPPEPCLRSLAPAGRGAAGAGPRAGFAEAPLSLGSVHLRVLCIFSRLGSSFFAALSNSPRSGQTRARAPTEGQLGASWFGQL